MFTGLIEETGRIERIEDTKAGKALTVRLILCARGLKTGDSLAVNGCCLTVANIRRTARATNARFDLLSETWRLTNLQFARPGSLVNLERPLAGKGRFGGHFVTGHIDGLGRIIGLQVRGKDRLLEVGAA